MSGHVLRDARGELLHWRVLPDLVQSSLAEEFACLCQLHQGVLSAMRNDETQNLLHSKTPVN